MKHPNGCFGGVMTELEIWLMFGKGRQSKLARELGCSRQNVNQGLAMNDDIISAINRVEKKEMSSRLCAESNVLIASALVTHELDVVRKNAYFNLVAWSEVYSRLVRG